jgi:hypothetical protein
VAVTQEQIDEMQRLLNAGDRAAPGQELLFAAQVTLDRTSMRIDDRMVEFAPGMAPAGVNFT